MRLLKGIVPAVLLATAPLSLAKKDKPDVSTKVFKSPLVNLFYFDDSEVVIGQEYESNVVWRSEDAGKNWDKIKDLPEVAGVIHSPFDNNLAVAIGISHNLEGPHRHWITYDQGKSWKRFETELPASVAGPPINFHAGDSKKIIFNTAEDCITAPCLGKSFYTTDGFKSAPKLLNGARKMCNWARSAPEFLADKKDKYDDRTLCITKGKYSIRSKDFRLLISDNYFADDREPIMASGRTVPGMVNMATVKNYFVVAAKAEKSNELALYTTDDTETWHRAEFGDHKIEEDAYTVLESTNYSIQVDVVTNRWALIGTLFTSNSNGTYFTKNIEHTNRNLEGYVDFEKISNIRGIVMVNVVDNYKETDNPLATKKLKSQISFDDGRSFHPLKVDGEELHLHSVTNQHNSGRVFSSPAPGIVMGVGNTGNTLRNYKDGDLYVSDDAGLTWKLALKEAHKYEFGDSGSILVAVYDEDETDTVMYSLKHGRPDTWKKIELGYKIRAHELTTMPDSTSLQFILVAMRHNKDGDREPVVISIDFGGLHEGDCKDGDFERWYARNDEDGKPTCVMGEKQSFRRRKWDAECFINEEFKDLVPKSEPCECDEAKDYECDYNFVPHWNDKGEKSCKPSPVYIPPEGACKGDQKTFKGTSGWRKIPGNKCTGKTKKDEEAEHKCEDIKKPVASGKISTEITQFKGKNFLEYFYLESLPSSDGKVKDETIVMLTTEREAYITHDHGKEWKKAVDDEVVAIYPHQYSNDRVFFITPTKKVYYSLDYGRKGSIHHFDAPSRPNAEFLQILAFHPNTKDNSDWLIWLGAEDCRAGSKDCHSTAYVSTQGGHKWDEMLPWVKKCSFMWREEGRGVGEKLVFCEQHAKEEKDGLVQLLASEDFFEHKDTRFKSVVAFATMSEFIIVATKGEDGKSLKLDASLDGKTFADAKFPPKFNVEHQTAYTVLDSSTHSVFVHVTVNPVAGQEYGSIIKSNSNGTSYVLSVNNVNRNTDGYVDFEKMQGIEGVAIINIVANAEQVDGGAKKKKQSKITHNDGADWEFMKPPAKNSEGNKYGCDVGNWKNGECSLHLHGYTERGDPRETFSSPTAVGVMMGVGNVGDSLQTIGEASTFITTDGGISWKEIKKGTYAWEFGDQGSVIVIVRRGEDTNHLYYSVDSGETWNRYDFSDKAIRVGSITTVPSDTSLNFLLWGKDGSQLVTVNIDFSGLFDKQCDLNEDEPESGDYELWSPQHPLSDEQECLFGHVAQYHRKRKESTKCYNGRKIDHLHSIARNCSCSRRDFECDYNFERKPGGGCVLIEGLEPPKGEAVCKQKGVKEWWDITGYRKIPISTCNGGREMEHTSTVHACPGFEDEFKRKHGISAFGLFLAIVFPFAAAAGVGYYVWKNCDGDFGRIRLGDSSTSFNSGSPWISWPVAAISGLVAVVAAVPLLVGAAWRGVSGMFGGYGGRTYTSRSSFARGRGEYTGVASDEGELLGDDSDEDV